MSVYAIFIALIIFILETPFFHCFGAIKRAKDHWLLSPMAKAIYYFGASILTFVYITPVIGGGAMLVLTSIIELFAQCQKSQDAVDVILFCHEQFKSYSHVLFQPTCTLTSLHFLDILMPFVCQYLGKQSCFIR